LLDDDAEFERMARIKAKMARMKGKQEEDARISGKGRMNVESLSLTSLCPLVL
jgi:translation initiation factor IF-1